MHVTTTRFGTLDLPDGSDLTFTQPILGFQDYRRFVLIDGPPGSQVVWLQSTESAELAFILMDPRHAMASYEIEVRPHDLTELAAQSIDDLTVYTLVVVPNDKTKVRTNLKAPILINKKRRLAKQIILDRSAYPVQFFLSQAQRDKDASKEVAHARADAQGG